MEKLDAYYIAGRLSDRDAKELKLLDRGLRTNEPLPHDRAAVADLIELELASSSGIAIRITDLGYRVLGFL